MGPWALRLAHSCECSLYTRLEMWLGVDTNALQISTVRVYTAPSYRCVAARHRAGKAADCTGRPCASRATCR